MSQNTVLEIAQNTIEIALIVSAPLLLVSLFIGLSISLFQVATSLQDVTLSFVPKIVGVGLILVIAGPWMLQKIVQYTAELFASIPEFVR